MAGSPRTPGFSSNQTCAATGVTYRVLDYWARLGVLRPSIAEARGNGTQRRYSGRDVRLGRALNVLRMMGASTDVLRAVTQALAEDELAGGMLVVSPLGEISRDVDEAASRWACWWCVNLDPVGVLDRQRVETLEDVSA